MYYGSQYTPANYNSYQQPMIQQNQYQQPQIGSQFQMQQQQSNSPVGLQGQPVADFETVKSYNIPLDGSVTYFPALNGSIIYTKQLNLSGNTEIKTYKLVEDNSMSAQSQQVDLTGYVKREEFETVKNTLNQLLEGLGGTGNATIQSNATNANVK